MQYARSGRCIQPTGTTPSPSRWKAVVGIRLACQRDETTYDSIE